MTELDLLIDFHLEAGRQGPGSSSDTLKALSFIDIDETEIIKVADIGCGSGAQTITLAQNINGQITAIDLFPQFLEKLNERAKKEGVEKKISTLQKSMDDLSFGANTFDIIWSEGAIYNIGFEEGIKQWSHFLKKGGYLALSEITWTNLTRPHALETYWKNAYPQIDTASNKIKILEENGFSPIGYFLLPPESWLRNYYEPIEKRFDSFLEKHKNSTAAQKLILDEKEEISNYRTYKDYYSYGFYIAKKIS